MLSSTHGYCSVGLASAMPPFRRSTMLLVHSEMQGANDGTSRHVPLTHTSLGTSRNLYQRIPKWKVDGKVPAFSKVSEAEKCRSSDCHRSSVLPNWRKVDLGWSTPPIIGTRVSCNQRHHSLSHTRGTSVAPRCNRTGNLRTSCICGYHELSHLGFLASGPTNSDITHPNKSK